jgi:hypothetical protein
VPAAVLAQGVDVPLRLDFRSPDGRAPHDTIVVLAEEAAG